MPTGLRRFQTSGHDHFICFNCFRKRTIFDTAGPRDAFVQILEDTRHKYGFDVLGYVVMPTHVHLLLSEPPEHSLAKAVQVMKQRFSRNCLETEVWETRYYDFNVFSDRKRAEKIEYMHMNPVTAGLVAAPGDWAWSSYGDLVAGAPGPVLLRR